MFGLLLTGIGGHSLQRTTFGGHDVNVPAAVAHRIERDLVAIRGPRRNEVVAWMRGELLNLAAAHRHLVDVLVAAPV